MAWAWWKILSRFLKLFLRRGPDMIPDVIAEMILAPSTEDS